ncbi:anaphase-promoting complex subunit CDC26-like [Chrysoperla carnea]|uniref:anaphase-promoting complex subunit CDC26-like n=1 Tax=Chrysoperla carnea TaxID=189513 RepID=UPI001D063743|nr:anaphase-promoting complex subunit CDC26-like [Chrysoperla carnea]
MIRRPPISIELKIDDLQEYENYCRETTTAKIQAKMTQAPARQPQNEVPSFPVAKTKQEIQERIGYVPKNNGS